MCALRVAARRLTRSPMLRKTIVAVAALSAPATPAIAYQAVVPDNGPRTETTSTATRFVTQRKAVKREAIKRKALRRNVRLARLQALRTGHDLPIAAYLRRARKRTTVELQRSN